MKRWLFNFATAVSLLLSLAAAAAWATSYAGPPAWRLVGVAHSADLTRVDRAPGTVLFTPAATWSTGPIHGFWDAGWALSQSGRLTILAQAVDYEGTLRRIYASPPSLIVEPSGDARSQAVVFGRPPESAPWATSLGFAFHSDARPFGGGDGFGGPGSARAWMLALPYWFFVLLGMPMPLLWLRFTRRRGDGPVTYRGIGRLED